MKVIDLISQKLRTRTTEELKKDLIEAQKSNDESSIIIFSAGLDILEKRLSASEYEKFEDSL